MLDFYRLKPFSLLPNPRFMYLSQQYVETKAKRGMACRLYFPRDRTASLYPCGPEGSSKTSLPRLIAQREDDDPPTKRHGMQSPLLHRPQPAHRQPALAPDLRQCGMECRAHGGSLKRLEAFLRELATGENGGLVRQAAGGHAAIDQLAGLLGRGALAEEGRSSHSSSNRLGSVSFSGPPSACRTTGLLRAEWPPAACTRRRWRRRAGRPR